MGERLIIRLASTASQKNHWLIYSGSEDAIVASGELDNAEQLNLLTEKARHATVICLLPGIDVALREIAVSGRFNRQMHQALPYLIEDELASDVETLHFSVLAKQAQLLHVAICEKQKIAMWLSWLEAADITCKQFIPEGLALPVAEQQHWSAVQLDNLWIVRESQYIAWSCEQEMLNVLLSSKSEQEPELHIDSYAPVTDKTEGNWTELEPMPAMAVFAQGVKHNKINLLTGEFKPRKEKNLQLQRWRMPIILSVCLLIILMANLYLKNVQVNKQILLTRAHVEQVYKQAFPLQSPLKYTRIKKKLNTMLVGLEGNTDTGLLVMLNELVPAFADNPQFNISNIKFDNSKQEIRLSASADNFQTFEKFNAAIAGHFDVEQGALSSTKEKVSGLLTIRMK